MNSPMQVESSVVRCDTGQDRAEMAAINDVIRIDQQKPYDSMIFHFAARWQRRV